MSHPEITDRAEFARLISAAKCLRVFLVPEVPPEERFATSWLGVCVEVPASQALDQLDAGGYDCLAWRTLNSGDPYICNDLAGVATRIDREIETLSKQAAKSRVVAAKLERSSDPVCRKGFDRQMGIVSACTARIETLRARRALSIAPPPSAVEAAP